MKYIGIDYGTKRTGIAISDTHGTIALPKDVLQGLRQDDVIARIKKFVIEEGVEAIVIGMPRRSDNSSSRITEIVERFIAKLANHVSVPIQTVDERLTSAMAARLMHATKRKTHDDIAAQILLQNFLDQQSKH